jgi:hypothetical protein
LIQQKKSWFIRLAFVIFEVNLSLKLIEYFARPGVCRKSTKMLKNTSVKLHFSGLCLCGKYTFTYVAKVNRLEMSDFTKQQPSASPMMSLGCRAVPGGLIIPSDKFVVVVVDCWP